MDKTMFLLIAPNLLVWLIVLQCSQANNPTPRQFYDFIDKSLTENALNCTKFIDKNWKNWLDLTEPPKFSKDGENLVLLKSLLSCLHKILTNMNETSPFALAENPQILYSVALSEVVSLRSDGILAIKACLFLKIKTY